MNISLENIEANNIEEYNDEPEPAPTLEQAQPTEKNDTENKNLIRKRLVLKLYFNEFPQLSEYNQNIEYMDYESLTDLQYELENVLAMSNGITNMQGMFMKGIQGLEMGLSLFTPINAAGLSDICENDPAFMDDVKLICLRYADSLNTSPEVRIGFSLMSNIFLLNKLNAMKQDEVNDKYSGLDEMDNFI